jgi:hypothetical protein
MLRYPKPLKNMEHLAMVLVPLESIERCIKLVSLRFDYGGEVMEY